VLVEHPRLSISYVDALEDAVAAQGTEVVGAQDRRIGGDDSPAEYGYDTVRHSRRR
jgi:hypothetical protein